MLEIHIYCLATLSYQQYGIRHLSSANGCNYSYKWIKNATKRACEPVSERSIPTFLKLIINNFLDVWWSCRPYQRRACIAHTHICRFSYCICTWSFSLALENFWLRCIRIHSVACLSFAIRYVIVATATATVVPSLCASVMGLFSWADIVCLFYFVYNVVWAPINYCRCAGNPNVL